MVTIWITCSFFHITTNNFAFVSLAWFHLIANFCAIKFRCSFKLFICHSFFFHFQWVVNGETLNLSFIFSAFTFLDNHFGTGFTTISVTLLLTLVFSTWKILLTFMRAQWNWVSASSSLSSDKWLNSIVSTRTIFHLLWISWAWFAFSFMTSSLAFMLSTV